MVGLKPGQPLAIRVRDGRLEIEMVAAFASWHAHQAVDCLTPPQTEECVDERPARQADRR